MAQMKVFVSHSTRDKAFCDTLVSALRGAGADVWYDQESLGAGHLRRVIMAELVARPVFVVVLSKEALASNWVQDECEWAYDLQRDDPTRLYLPVLAGALERADLNVALFIRSMKRVEGDELRPLPTTEAVAQTLRLLALTASGEAPISTVPQPSESAADVLARGKALNAQDKFAEALPLLLRATELDPNSVDAWANLSRVQSRLDRPTDGLAASERALQLDGNFAYAWYAKGLALNNLGRDDEELAACDRALAIDPNYATAWNSKGNALWGLKRFQDAVSAYDKALAIDPTYAQAMSNKAISLRALGRKREAEEAERRAKALGG